MKALLTALACSLVLSACALEPTQTGPTLTTGSLRGTIKDGVFRDERNWFHVGIPFQKDGAVPLSVQLQESYPASNVSFAGFNALDTPGEYYKVYVEDVFANNHPVPDMDHVADAALQIYAKQLTTTRNSSLVLQMEKPWTMGATRGLMRFYTQRAPVESLALDLMHGPGLAEDYTAYILMYVTAQNGKVAMVWAEWPEGCTLCAPVPAGTAPAPDADAMDQALARDARAQAFFDSFGYDAGASAYQ